MNNQNDKQNYEYKNFEKEYKEFNQQELPDLWNRIEAGLSEKTLTPTKVKFFTPRRIKTFSAVAALFICFIAAIPALFYLKNNTTMLQEATTTAMDVATEESMLVTQSMEETSTDSTASSDGYSASLEEEKTMADTAVAKVEEESASDQTQNETLTEAAESTEAPAVEENMIMGVAPVETDVFTVTIQVESIEKSTQITTLYCTITDAGTSTLAGEQTIAIYLDAAQYENYKEILNKWETIEYSAILDTTTETIDETGQCVAYNLVDLY